MVAESTTTTLETQAETPAGFSAAVPDQPLSKEAVSLRFTDAIRAFYQHIDVGGKVAAVVVAWGAVLVREHEITNKEFSELLKSGAAFLGSTKDAMLAGHQVPLKQVQVQQGEGYALPGSHPYKQHGRRWRQLSCWQANMPTSVKAVEDGLEKPFKDWPDMFKVGDKMYRSPVEALEDGNSLERVHVAWGSVIRPQIEKLFELVPGKRRDGRIRAGADAGAKMQVTVRVFNNELKREERSRIVLAKRKDTAAIYGACVGLLGLLYQGGMVKLDPADKAQLVAFLVDGTAPTNVPITVDNDDEDGA